MTAQSQTAQPGEPPVPPSKSGRGVRIALAISLGVNLAVVGVFAGAMLRDGHGMRGSMVRDLGFGLFTEALSREDRRAMRDSLFERAPDIREARRVQRADARFSTNTICFDNRQLCVVNPNYLNSVREDRAGTNLDGRDLVIVHFGKDGRVDASCYDDACALVLK